MNTRLAIPLAALAALAALIACGDGGGPTTGPDQVAITEADRAAARQKFDTLCFTCHGKTGGGDGPASAGLTPPPRNLQDPAWQASVTDAHIETIIVSGGAAVGKSLAMPSNPDLKAKPGVVAALREHIRSLARR